MNNVMIETAKKLVMDYFNQHKDKTDYYELTKDDVFIVWFCKTLQNWKALISTDVINGLYWEVTHNGDKNETYVDMYTKTNNICVKGDK